MKHLSFLNYWNIHDSHKKVGRNDVATYTEFGKLFLMLSLMHRSTPLDTGEMFSSEFSISWMKVLGLQVLDLGFKYCQRLSTAPYIIWGKSASKEHSSCYRTVLLGIAFLSEMQDNFKSAFRT